jgi:Transposase DDE domain
MNWRGARSVWPSSPRFAPRSRHGLGNVSTIPRWTSISPVRRLKAPDGKKLYALRKHPPEPVFGIIKSVLGFRQFPLRGLDSVRGQWSLVTMAWNLKRMFILNPAE